MRLSLSLVNWGFGRGADCRVQSAERRVYGAKVVVESAFTEGIRFS